MAEDRLMFPIGFDLDSATKDAENEWDSKYAAQLEKALQKRPIKIKLSYDVKQLDNLEAVQKRLKELKLAPVTPETKGAISSLVSELKKLESILTKIQSLNQKSALISAKAATEEARTKDVLARTLAREEKLKRDILIYEQRVEQAKKRTAIAEERYRKAVEGTARAYSNTEGYISRLLRRTAVLFGISQVARFTERLRETTAEFELQRVSLGAIIQDTERANALFNQIKTFAVQSPFEIKDLVGYVKQLSAYRIETDKLFDTTKRLADVSAGLGVDMQRLILAYGQVKAASVLRGTEVRQFTEAGIPLIELLAEKFTTLRGEMVSTGEVFDLISQRAVSFEMVAEIFEDMTNAGGMFYNMQEKQAATLAGQWSNLKDSLSIMYDEMGNTSGVRGAMEGMISLVKTLADNWQLVSGLMLQTLGGAAILGVINKFKSLWNMLGVQMFSATQKVAVAQDRYNAAIARQNALLPTATNLERAAAAQKVKSAAAALNAAKATEAAAASTSRLAFAWRKFTMALKANWVSVVIGLLVTLGQVIAHIIKKSNELKNALADIGEEGKKSIEKSTYNFERLAKKAVEAADGSKEQKDALSELHRTYRDMIPIQDMTIDKLRELKGNYEALTQAVREYINQRTLESKINAITEKFSEDITDAKKELDDIFKKGTYQQFRQKDTLLFGKVSSWKKTDIPFELDDAQISEVKRQVQMLAEDTSKSYYEIWVKALSEVVDVTPEIKKAISEMLEPASGVNNQMKALIDSTRGMQKSIKDVTDEMAGSTKYVGIYRKEWEALQKSVGEVKVDFLGDGGQETFLSRQDKVNKQVNLYAQAIKDAVATTNKDLAEAGKPLIKLQDEWFNLVDAIDEANPSRVSNIQIDAIIKGLSGKYPQLKKYLEKIREEYYKVIPDSRTVNVLNETMTKYAKSVDISMDNVKQYLMGSGDTIEEYAKRAQEDLARVTATLTEMAFIDSQISKGIDIGVYKPTDPDEKKKAEDSEKFLKHLIELLDEFTKKSGRTGRTDNTQLNLLKEEASLLQRVYKEYTELINIQSQAAAAKKIKDIYGGLLSSFGIDAAPTTFEGLMNGLDSVVKRMEKLPDSQKSVVELKAIIGSLNTNKEKAKLESELKRLADEVSRTKTAKEFFDKMLNLTGDQELSATVTMSVYGAKGDDLKRKLIDQIRNAFGTTTGEELDLSLAINYNTLEVDYLKLAQIAEENKGILLEASKATRDGIIKNGLETTAARIMQWEKDIQKEKSFAEKRIQIAQETAQQIIDIERSNLPKEEKERLTTGYKQRETDQVGQLMWDNFKNTPLYIKMFDNLENASTTMLNAMRDKLKELESQWGKSLNPTELKELQNRMNEIDQQLAMKNPFKTLGNAIKEYMALREQGTRKQAETQYAADVEANKKAWDELNFATARAEQAKIEYDKVSTDPTASDKELFTARALVDLTKSRVEYAKENVDKTEEDVKESGKIVSRWKALADATKDASTAIGAYTEMITKAGQGIIQMMEAFGAGEEDVQFMQDIVGGIGKIGQGAQDAVAGILSGNPVAAISGVVSGLGNIVSGVTDIFYAGRVKRANKEIKKQQKILDSLEHSYDRLQKAADSLFGSEYVANFHKQQKNLQAQIAATEKQLAAERSKGKKADDEKIKQYEEQIQSLKDELEDMQGKLAEHMLGTDLASAARSFAQAWLDAYKEFGDTRKAIEGEMEDMMQNLIQEAVFGAVMQNALKDLYKFIDESDPSDMQDEKFWKTVNEMYHQAIEYMDTGASVTAGWMEELGMLSRDLGDDFTGISKDIATASEESILGLSSLINTSLFYVSNIDRNVAQITALLGGGMDLSSNEQLIDIFTIQNQHLAYLPNIALNTAQTAERCERAAAACENIAENLNRVIKPNGVQGSYRVNTSL